MVPTTHPDNNSVRTAEEKGKNVGTIPPGACAISCKFCMVLLYHTLPAMTLVVLYQVILPADLWTAGTVPYGSIHFYKCHKLKNIKNS